MSVATDILDKSDKYLFNLLGENGQEPVDANTDAVQIELPSWFDAERFRRSQKFQQKYFTGAFGGMLAGLVSILAIPTILGVLMCTGKSNNAMTAYRRYVKTIYHVAIWFYSGFRPGTKAWQSIEIVRKKHLSARKFCEKAKNLTITQRDMAITQFGFMGYMVLRPKIIGIHVVDAKEMEEAIYFWRVLGYLMGIKDEFNVCTDSFPETQRRAQMILQTVIRPALENPIPDFKPMTTALVDGLWHFTHYLDVNATIYLVKRLAGCKGYEYFDRDFQSEPTEEDRQQMVYYQLSFYEKLVVAFAILVHEYELQLKFFRWYLKMEALITIWVSLYLPITAIFTFGVKKAYVRIFKSKARSKVDHED